MGGTFIMPVSKVLTTLILIYLQVVTSIPSCNSDRPGGESHRTSYVSQSSLSNTEEDDKWTNVLCCVYTHVKIYNNENWDGWLELYDGSWESTSGNTLPKMAQDAYNQICDMSMGSIDCMNQKSCVDNALEIASTNSPTLKSTAKQKKKKKKKKKKSNKKKKRKKKKNGESKI